jgi:hypothetical protein
MLLLGLLGVGCTNFSSGPRPTALPALPARDLLLDTRAFPQGWVAGPCAPDCSRSEGETHALRSFYLIGIPGQVLQEVVRLESVQAATAMFQRARQTDFRDRVSPNRQFVPPPEIPYRSPIADAYYFGCGIDEVPACKMIMRKGNYFISVFLNVDRGEVDGHGLKITNIEPILRAVDARVAARFSIPLP